MNSKINLKVNKDKPSIQFVPPLDTDSFVHHVNNALNTMPTALLQMYATIPVLRPATAREKEAHCYVFNEGEKGEVENRLYKYRKDIYDFTAAVFSKLLAEAFPDIEYIEGCKQYQQNYCMDHTEEESNAYKNIVEEVSKYVRENFEEVLKEVTDHVQED